MFCWLQSRHIDSKMNMNRTKNKKQKGRTINHHVIELLVVFSFSWFFCTQILVGFKVNSNGVAFVCSVTSSFKHGFSSIFVYKTWSFFHKNSQIVADRLEKVSFSYADVGKEFEANRMIFDGRANRL